MFNLTKMATDFFQNMLKSIPIAMDKMIRTTGFLLCRCAAYKSHTHSSICAAYPNHLEQDTYTRENFFKGCYRTHPKTVKEKLKNSSLSSWKQHIQHKSMVNILLKLILRGVAYCNTNHPSAITRNNKKIHSDQYFRPQINIK